MVFSRGVGESLRPDCCVDRVSLGGGRHAHVFGMRM